MYNSDILTNMHSVYIQLDDCFDCIYRFPHVFTQIICLASGLFALFHFISIQNSPKMGVISKNSRCKFHMWIHGCCSFYILLYLIYIYTVVFYSIWGMVSYAYVFKVRLQVKGHAVQFACIYVAFLTIVNVANELFWVCCLKSLSQQMAQKHLWNWRFMNVVLSGHEKLHFKSFLLFQQLHSMYLV